MILHFPDQDTLLVALTSGILPADVQSAPASFGTGKQGDLFIEPSRKIPRATLAELKKLGVSSGRLSKGNLNETILCWPQLLSLGPNEEGEYGETNNVLFELREPHQLVELVSEILRLGNDRQSFRYLDSSEGSCALLRVTNPPYYSLLRAIDDQAADCPMAFVEASSRVWVQVGYTQPLVERIRPPAGKLLLIRSPRNWTMLDEHPFQDVYRQMDLRLPHSETSWHESEFSERIRVPLTLAPGNTGEAAELWVLRDQAAEQIERFVANSDDRLLERLSFAVSGSSPDQRVVLRVRPSKQSLPVVVLDCVAYRSYLKLPNLFIPVGRRLHPPLRRDVVADLLAADGERIHWLHPEEDGAFVPESLPDSAFRPLRDWVDYVLDCEHQPLEAWVESHRFDFESFICEDELARTEEPAPDDKSPEKEFGDNQRRSPTQTPLNDYRPAGDDNEATMTETTEASVEPKHLRQQLHQVERAFLDSDQPIDSDDRRRMWQQMGELNAHLSHRLDTTICWSNALWRDAPPETQRTAKWLACEGHSISKSDFTASDFDDVLSSTSPKSSDISLVASYLVHAACMDRPPTELSARLNELREFFLQYESSIPIRTAWLAWCALYRLSNNDVLLLARARDRMLQRLHTHGFTAEFDLPSFLRIGGSETGGRFRLLREQLTSELRPRVMRFLGKPTSPDAQTRTYSDCILAFGLARLGESGKCIELLDAALAQLSDRDHVHKWLGEAYKYRVIQALHKETDPGQLDGQLMERLTSMDRLSRYKVDKLRQHSRILEPHERVDPYVRWHGRFNDELGRALADLREVSDIDELHERSETLLKTTSSNREQQVRCLVAALELSPRMSEKAANRLLDRVPASLKRSTAVESALLLEKALYVAAHFGRDDSVAQFVDAFEKALPAIVSEFLVMKIEYQPENKEKIDTIESLFTRSFHDLRRLGMRNEISRMYGDLADLVHDRSHSGPPESSSIARPMRLLLSAASGWFYFGQFEKAAEIVDEVRGLLFEGLLPAIEQKNLSCAYAQSVGHAPPEFALERVLELFEFREDGIERKLKGIDDNMTTSSHFSVPQIDLVEASVLALVSDDYSLNAESRLWLDEDEYLVRKRIHDDVRIALQAS